MYDIMCQCVFTRSTLEILSKSLDTMVNLKNFKIILVVYQWPSCFLFMRQPSCVSVIIQCKSCSNLVPDCSRLVYLPSFARMLQEWPSVENNLLYLCKSLTTKCGLALAPLQLGLVWGFCWFQILKLKKLYVT